MGTDERQGFAKFAVVLRCVLLGLAVLQLSGCSCLKRPMTTEEEELLKRRQELAKEKKPKPDFEQIRVKALPCDDEDVRVIVKPGHWASFRYVFKANNDDVKGDLQVTCVDSNSEPIHLERSHFTISSTRPVVLPKGQERRIEAVQYVTSVTDNDKDPTRQQIRLSARLTERGRQLTPTDLMPTVRLSPEQYHFVVLSNSPDRHGHLKLRSAIKPPRDEWRSTGIDTLYYVDFPDVTAELPLPTHPLTWTSIAYVLWDDIQPDVLDSSQQSAMLDWLHWGGTLIVSGPNTLEILRGSFLDHYLPASPGESVTLSAKAATTLNDLWRPSDATDQFRTLPIRPDRNLNLITLSLLPGGRFVPGTANLVADRRVGRGRIVLTAFAMADREILEWGGFDNFLNSCLMGKPGRRFIKGLRNRMPDVQYVDESGNPLAASEVLVASGLRYASRDATASWDGKFEASDRAEEPLDRERSVRRGATDDWRLAYEPTRYGGFRSDETYGVAGWSDFSPMANAARDALQSAAGIEVPRRRFVLKMLGAYLFCLVPLNWSFFKLIGRVEWAWFVAPLIAVGGAIGVIQLAQLDIGFARSRTEIDVLEIQSDYPRGHLTRFAGLYTSLTTNYEVAQDDRSALFLPFSTNPRPDGLRLAVDRDAVYAEERRDRVSMSGIRVLSNSTGMLRSESYLDLAGNPQLVGETLDDLSIQNETGFDWYNAVVLTRTTEGVRAAVVDEVPDAMSRKLKFAAPAVATGITDELKSCSVTHTSPASGEVSLYQLYKIASNVSSLQVGESRLIAWTDAPLGDMQVNPLSNQAKIVTLIVSHLKYRDALDPQPDVNSRSSVPDPFADG